MCVYVCLTVYRYYMSREQNRCHSASTEMCSISCMSHFRSTCFHTVNASSFRTQIFLFVCLSISIDNNSHEVKCIKVNASIHRFCICFGSTLWLRHHFSQFFMTGGDSCTLRVFFVASFLWVYLMFVCC